MRFCVRLAMPEDREQLRSLSCGAALECEPDLGFDNAVFDRTFDGVLRGTPTGFVAALGHVIVGFALCEIEGFHFASGISTVLQIIYVRPDKRGTRAAALLLAEFIRWSEIVGSRRRYLGINTGQGIERTARFFERAGARSLGHCMVI